LLVEIINLQPKPKELCRPVLTLLYAEPYLTETLPYKHKLIEIFLYTSSLKITVIKCKNISKFSRDIRNIPPRSTKMSSAFCLHHRTLPSKAEHTRNLQIFLLLSSADSVFGFIYS
jgi:hypothetical protein